MGEAYKKQSIMGAGPARMNMEREIECKKELAFGNQGDSSS